MRIKCLEVERGHAPFAGLIRPDPIIADPGILIGNLLGAELNPLEPGGDMPIDPVCKKNVEISRAVASYDYHSWTVYFDSVECLKKFERDPEAYMRGLDDEEITAA